ncbi:hypothetical protein [Burkholderia cepacia]|uniref:hypothetical protein n=1 Tax=Burkholderia cepacia TaxID=292 RepID=UPI002AB69DE2|nr:hypothetical protein [Burkholderia cepacia]
MFSEFDCKALRDLLFAMRFATEENIFELLAVVPGGTGFADATIHFAHTDAVWERAACSADPAEYLRELVGQTPFAGRDFRIEQHSFDEERWPIAWAVTANRHIPEIVLLEAADGSVTGVVMRETRYSTHVKFAGGYVEPSEVRAGIAHLRDLGPTSMFRDWAKERNIDASTIDEALLNSPESAHGQKFVLVYRDNEWLWGIWNNPNKGGPLAGSFHLTSVCDFHGTRASRAKREKRLGLERVRETALTGDYGSLNASLHMIHTLAVPDSGAAHDYENNPAVKLLCDWWNSIAPEGMREAGAFRVYTWHPKDRTFIAGDPEEPALQVVDSVDYSGYALFEADREPIVLVWFLRGRRFNKGENGGTMVYCADGEEAYDIGADLQDVDEAYYSLVGLERLASDVEHLAIVNAK